LDSFEGKDQRINLPARSYALRLATVDFFGTDDFRARVEAVFSFDVVRDLVPDEERDDREFDRPMAPTGHVRYAHLMLPVRHVSE
jgi:hypothetical protein